MAQGEGSEGVKEEIIRQFQKAGARVSDDFRRIEVPLPSAQGKAQGKLICEFLGRNVLFNFIDIHSTAIPDIVANPVQESRELKVNYCARGRCELQLKSGECTYLTAGEIAVDAGQAENSFYYPGAEYKGYEIIVSMDAKGHAEKAGFGSWFAAEELYERVLGLERPWIQKAGRFVGTFYDAFRHYAENDLGIDLLTLRCMELLAYLVKVNFNQPQASRTYCTASQVAIAKRVKEVICSDLSVRHTARELADRFGVSETSVKNYFRSVYGCGFAEFQQHARMDQAANLLVEGDGKVSDIGLAVGFSSQPKFGAAFKAHFGMTPLEYRRMKRLEEFGGEDSPSL